MSISEIARSARSFSTHAHFAVSVCQATMTAATRTRTGFTEVKNRRLLAVKAPFPHQLLAVFTV